jgi:FkbM family methyltransferase
MQIIKKAIRSTIARLGYDIVRRPAHAFSDMKCFVPPDGRALILDVGANVGQSARKFKQVFPLSIVHCFEPSRDTFGQLKQNIAGEKGVFAWECALGSTVGKKSFIENTDSDMSSFLQLSKTGWGEVKKHETVDVTTVDRFLSDHAIASVDILKSDTQGYDFEVFKGAEQAMRENRIGLIYFEFIFSEMYRDLPQFDEVYRFLVDRGFLLVSIYDFHRRNNLADWADMLFVNREYHRRSA